MPRALRLSEGSWPPGSRVPVSSSRGPRSVRITSVWVAGQVRKWDGELVGVDVDELRTQVHDSLAAITERLATPVSDR